jgi:death-on-curing family protein
MEKDAEEISAEELPHRLVKEEDAAMMEKHILGLHDLVIQSTGEPAGVRAGVSLRIAARKLFAILIGDKSPFHKTALIYQELAANHYFIEGNKRTAHVVAKSNLFILGYHFKPKYKDAVETIKRIASGEMETDEIIKWVAVQSIKYKEKTAKEYLTKILKEAAQKESRRRPSHGSKNKKL